MCMATINLYYDVGNLKQNMKGGDHLKVDKRSGDYTSVGLA